MSMSTYVHSSVYHFDQIARAELQHRFIDLIGSVAVACEYDAADQSFTVACPADLGLQCDITFGSLLESYIAEELGKAEREDREPRVKRIAGCNFSHITDHIESTPGDTAEPSTLKAVPERGDVSVHCVAGSVIVAKCSFFHMYELPDALLERTLARPKTWENRIEKVFAARAVQFNKRDNDYEFNGRTGVRVPWNAQSEQIAQEAMLIFALPLPMQDEREGANGRPPQGLSKPDQLARQEPTVQRWVDVVESTSPIGDPNFVKSEMPHDARLLLTRPTIAGTGRARVPKSFAALLKSSTGMSDSIAATNFARVGTLLLENVKSARSKYDAESDSQELSLGKLTSGYSTVRPSSVAEQPTRQTPLEGPKIMSVQYTRQQIQQGAFVDFGNTYTAFDNYGWKSNAASTAQWNNENHLLTRRSPKKPGRVVLRSSTLASNSLPNSRAASTSGARSATVSGQSLSSGDDLPQPWAHKVVEAEQPIQAVGFVGKLIDDSASETQSVVEPPPGFDSLSVVHPPLGSLWPPGLPRPASLRYPLQNDWPGLDTASTRAPNSSTEVAEDIGFENGGTSKAEQPTTEPSNNNARSGFSDAIAKQDHTPQKRYTMRQKARKPHDRKSNRGEQKSDKGDMARLSKGKVELPLPSPPRAKPAQAENVFNQQPARRTAQTHVVAAPTSPQVPATTVDHGGEDEDRPENFMEVTQPFGQLLEHFGFANETDSDPQKYTLLTQFGLILCKPPEDSYLGKGSYGIKRLDAKLNQAPLKTFFLDRLTTSTSDAFDLLSLFREFCDDEAQEPEYQVFYEIRVHSPDDGPLRIAVDPSQKADATVTRATTNVGEAFLHYPIHVWDAKMTIRDRGLKAPATSIRAIQNLVDSLQTTRQAPSFVGCASMFVASVHMKRVFTLRSENIQFKVTENQELEVMPLEQNPKFNFTAEALPRDAMIEQNRLWWEASIVTYDLLTAAHEIRILVDGVVERIDNVGINNVGPFARHEGGEDDDGDEAKTAAKSWLW